MKTSFTYLKLKTREKREDSMIYNPKNGNINASILMINKL